MGRTTLLLVLLGVLGLYIHPILAYWSSWHQARATRAQIHRLEHDNAGLRARRRTLGRPATVEREARALGFVAPGEQPYVVRGLPSGH